MNSRSSQSTSILDDKVAEINCLNEQILDLQAKVNDTSNELSSTNSILENLNEVKIYLESELKISKEANLLYSSQPDLERLKLSNEQFLCDNELKSKEIESLNFLISQLKNDHSSDLASINDLKVLLIEKENELKLQIVFYYYFLIII